MYTCTCGSSFALIWCKSVSISKSNTGAIRINLTFLSFDGGSVKYSELFTIKVDDEIDMYGHTFVCVSRSESNMTTKVGLINKSSYKERKLTTQILFRTLPTALVTAARHQIINSVTIPSIDNPDVKMFFREVSDDLYGNGGYTVSDVLDEVSDMLEINISVPNMFDYQISNLTLNVGSTVMQIITNLLPVPGLTASYRGDNSIYIREAQSEGEFNSFVNSLPPCNVESLNISYNDFYYIVEGQKGEPEGIEYNTDTILDINSSDINNYTSESPTTSWNLGIIYNLFGEIFGMSYSSTSEETMQQHIVLPKDILFTDLTEVGGGNN